MLFSQSVEDEG